MGGSGTNTVTIYKTNMSSIVFLFPRRCAPLIAPSSRFATPNPSFQKEGTTLGARMSDHAFCFFLFLPDEEVISQK